MSNMNDQPKLIGVDSHPLELQWLRYVHVPSALLAQSLVCCPTQRIIPDGAVIAYLVSLRKGIWQAYREMFWADAAFVSTMSPKREHGTSSRALDINFCRAVGTNYDITYIFWDKIVSNAYIKPVSCIRMHCCVYY